MRFMVQCVVCMLMLGAVFSQPVGAAEESTWQKPETKASVPTPFPRKFNGYRLLVPERMTSRQANIRVEAMGKLIEGWEPTARPVVSVKLSNQVGESLDATIELQRGGSRRDPKWEGEGSISIPASWDDGPLKTEMWPTADADTTQAAHASSSGSLIAQWVEGVPVAYRGELRHWIDEDSSTRAIWGRKPTWQNLPLAMERGEAGEDPFAEMRGFTFRSYESAHWAERQGYTLYVPKALDMSQPAPLLILLHGSGGDYRNIIADEAAGQRFEAHPMLIANAGAYAQQEYRHLALQDILAVLQDVSQKYDVDPNRVYLQGISLGGRGTLEAAALRPDLFAAISSHGVYGLQEDLVDPIAHVTDDPTARSYRARRDIRTWLPNLIHMPVEFVYGRKDVNTPPEQPILFGRMLRFAGADPEKVSMRGFDTDHNIALPSYDWATTRQWFLQQQRIPAAERNKITIRPPNLRYARSGWLHLGRPLDYARIPEVAATWEVLELSDEQLLAQGFQAGTKPVLMRVSTQNTQLFALDPLPIDALIIDNARLVLAQMSKAIPRFVSRNDAGVWELISAESYQELLTGSEGLVKTAEQSGPLWDFWTKPAYGVWDDQAEQSDERQSQLEQTLAASLTWWDKHNGKQTLAHGKLSELTPAQRTQRNLMVMTGDVSSCDLLNNIDLPTPFDQPNSGNEIRIALRPSPWSEQHYLLIIENPTALPFHLHHLGWWDRGLHSDWLVATARRRGRWLQATIQRAGTYDHFWQAGSETAIDPRGDAMLGPASGGH